jgi:putative tryptophan/tyrosine transport system substrate-binding protein
MSAFDPERSFVGRNRIGHVGRREILIATGALFAAPLVSFAQPGKIWQVGFLYFGSRQSAQETGRYAAFLQGMRELGYVEGKNLVVEARFADGKTERLPELAAELVRSKVDLIIAGGTPANDAAKKATTTIPIVIALSSDPVAEGLAASMARPGGNLTGLETLGSELSQKYIELLTTLVGKQSRVGVLTNSGNISHPAQLKPLQAAAQKSGIALVPVDARTSGEIESGFARLVRERVKAVVILGDSFFVQQRIQIAGFATKHRLATIAPGREHPDAGGLMSYGPDLKYNFRRAATYVDKIFRGAKPGDLPIEQPKTFELVINLKTAKALGIAIPRELLSRADEVIQ